MTSGDNAGACGGVRARIFSLISRAEADGEDDGARMSCTYPIDLNPRTLRNVNQRKSRREIATLTNTLLDSGAFRLPSQWVHRRA
jgi:hypothetical protein